MPSHIRDRNSLTTGPRYRCGRGICALTRDNVTPERQFAHGSHRQLPDGEPVSSLQSREKSFIVGSMLNEHGQKTSDACARPLDEFSTIRLAQREVTGAQKLGFVHAMDATRYDEVLGIGTVHNVVTPYVHKVMKLCTALTRTRYPKPRRNTMPTLSP